MKTFRIRHEETLVDFFDVEAETADEALEEYHHLVSEGKIDFSDLEMIDSSDTVTGVVQELDGDEIKLNIQQAIQFARDGGYARVMILDKAKGILLTEYYLRDDDAWIKNTNIAPFVVKEYADQEVDKMLQHPAQPDTMMIFTTYDPHLQRAAANHCRKAIKAGRNNKNPKEQ